MSQQVGRSPGRVLRVQRGYNPNSSSVGSQIPLFLGAALGAGALTVVGVQLLAAFRSGAGIQGPHGAPQEPPPPPSPPPAVAPEEGP